MLFTGPSVEIRTRGLLNPIQARYQTSPHPDILFVALSWRLRYITTYLQKKQVFFSLFFKFFILHKKTEKTAIFLKKQWFSKQLRSWLEEIYAGAGKAYLFRAGCLIGFRRQIHEISADIDHMNTHINLFART